MTAFEIIRYIITVLIVGGGLWKGLEAFARVLDAVSNSLKLKAEAEFERRRLEDEQIKTYYYHAQELIKAQDLRIKGLYDQIAELERESDSREESLRGKIKDLDSEMMFLKADYEAIKSNYHNLQAEYLALKGEHDSLKKSYGDLKRINDGLRARIRKLESKNKESSDG